MQLDKNIINNISKLDDEEFKTKLSSILDAMGVDNKKSKKILSDIPKVKQQVSSFSQEDLDRYSKFLGEDTTKQLINKITDTLEGK